MINLIVSAAAAAILAAGAPAADPFAGVNRDQFEGLSHDSVAAWSYGWNSVKVDGTVRTLMAQLIYDTPAPLDGDPTPVAYSLRTVAIDCSARTIAVINGANYTAGGVVVVVTGSSPATPWSNGSQGLQDFASQICQTDWSKL